MKNLTIKLRNMHQMAMVLVLFASPLAGAYAACCTGHGGVASCNQTTGYKVCKDGTASPSCTCPIKKAAVKKAAPVVTKPKATVKTPSATTKATTPVQKTQPKSSWWGGQSTTAPAVTTSAKGCCSRHGGVASCNKLKGHPTCKDGTISPTCSCH